MRSPFRSRWRHQASTCLIPLFTVYRQPAELATVVDGAVAPKKLTISIESTTVSPSTETIYILTYRSVSKTMTMNAFVVRIFGDPTKCFFIRIIRSAQHKFKIMKFLLSTACLGNDYYTWVCTVKTMGRQKLHDVKWCQDDNDIIVTVTDAGTLRWCQEVTYTEITFSLKITE